MRIAVIGSTGRTGRLLVAQALDRGHEVIALARTPERLADLAEETARAPALRIVAADVAEPAGVVDAARGSDAIVSGLGVSRGQDAQILAAGARAVCSAGPRVVWLGALGTGPTRGALGKVNDALLRRALRYEWEAKALADQVVLGSGGTVVHAGPLTNRPLPGARSLIEPADLPRRILPASAPRAGVAALMLDEAERPGFAGAVAVPWFRALG